MFILRIWAIVFLLFLLMPPLLTGVIIIKGTNEIIEKSVITTQYAYIYILKHHIESFLTTVADDLLFLAQSPPLQAYLALRNQEVSSTTSSESVVLTIPHLEKTKQLRRVLAEEFLLFSRHRTIYDQVRYLDETGQEMVRINVNKAVSKIVADEDLQNKSDRYYFKETMPLSSEEIFVSPLDLNSEKGTLERPLKPIIRYATPVYYNKGRKAGIVVLNVNADQFLHPLGRVRLIDSAGYFLNHPNSNNCWGGPNDLNTGYKFSQEYPQLANQISAQAGVYETDNQIVLLQPINVPQASYHWTLILPQDKNIIPQLITRFHLWLNVLSMSIGLVGLIWLLKFKRFR